MTLMMMKVPTPAKTTVATVATIWMTSCSGLPLDQAGDATDRGDREDAGADRAPHAADAVDGEDVEGVVDREALAQERDAEAGGACDEAEGQRATDGRRSRQPG